MLKEVFQTNVLFVFSFFLKKNDLTNSVGTIGQLFDKTQLDSYLVPMWKLIPSSLKKDRKQGKEEGKKEGEERKKKT